MILISNSIQNESIKIFNNEEIRLMIKVETHKKITFQELNWDQ